MTSNSPVQAWMATLSGSLLFFFGTIQINLFNALSSPLMETFHFSATEIGQLSTSYFYSSVIFLFPAGLLLDRYSPRRIILLAMLGTVALTFWFSAAHNFTEIFIIRFLSGACCTFCLIASLRVASRWFPPKRMALVVGVIIAVSTIGAILSQAPFTFLTDSMGWRQALFILGILGALLFIPMFIFIKNGPDKNNQPQATKNSQAVLNIKEAVRQTFSNTQNWLGGIYLSLSNVPVVLLNSTWGNLFLTQAHHMDRFESSMMFTILGLGILIGSSIGGALSDYFHNRKFPMMFSVVCCLAFLLSIIYIHEPSLGTLRILFFFFGFVGSFQAVGYQLVTESNSKELTGTVQGLISMLVSAGGFSVALFPYFLNKNGAQQAGDQIPVYSLPDYQFALTLICIAYVIAFIAGFLLRETHAKQME